MSTFLKVVSKPLPVIPKSEASPFIYSWEIETNEASVDEPSLLVKSIVNFAFSEGCLYNSSFAVIPISFYTLSSF